jgi:N6-L-threonylcarbamoyladenine synthase
VLTLGIETSCDETAAAVVDEHGHVLSDVIHSQVSTHAEYGGVVPELASRDHLRHIVPVVRAALHEASTTLDAIDGIAVTCRPGLSGALLVGVQMAKGLAWSRTLPIVGVDHLVGHLLAVFLRHPGEPPAQVDFPYVALLVSGGHTAIYRVDGSATSDISELGATRDDAAGEAYDKVAKLTGLGYPGGPVIDRLAHEGDASCVPLTMPMHRRDSLEFSFSGLKTNVARWVDNNGPLNNDAQLRNLCAAFQHCVVETLLTKTFRAAKAQNLKTVVLAGGVAANRGLRSRAEVYAQRHGMRVVIPPMRSCTDNAAMIAYSGSRLLSAGENHCEQLEMSPSTALERVTRKGRGRRHRPRTAAAGD